MLFRGGEFKIYIWKEVYSSGVKEWGGLEIWQMIRKMQCHFIHL